MTAAEFVPWIVISPTAALAMMLVPTATGALYVAVRLYPVLWDELLAPVVAVASTVARTGGYGRHHRGGRHCAGRLQGNPPPTPEHLDGPPTTAPAQPAPKGGAA